MYSRPIILASSLMVFAVAAMITPINSAAIAQEQVPPQVIIGQSENVPLAQDREDQPDGEAQSGNNGEALGNGAVLAASRLRDAVTRIDPGAQLLPNGANLTVQGVNVTLVYDINADRMRIVTPVASFNDVKTEDIVRLMQANFDSALDARYALAQGAIWSTFIHPLSSLTLDDFASGLGQTVNLALTYGSSYSSGALVFGGGDSQEQQRELIDELQDKSREI